ncbi:uncharacterized protein SETTUDRAFT_29962 [Exserohilum turcica Et28A]|uniref:Uncharacterized protein n=1 Tax=Exserohilum turcicum (strain 28A) TaxID=671987 RepID=R0KUE4_EXST2|nr:uncharacterized protein SETTUDRAFT_29962 [Exserohilum turcica Et28A]EOA91422.1 hypothetical protein SETTUDRAFT_29962 [Exserohilum turcica Et28A]
MPLMLGRRRLAAASLPLCLARHPRAPFVARQRQPAHRAAASSAHPPHSDNRLFFCSKRPPQGPARPASTILAWCHGTNASASPLHDDVGCGHARMPQTPRDS